MDEIDDIEAYENYEMLRNNGVRNNDDFLAEMNDSLFVKSFRFSKAGVERLTALLDEELGDEPVHALSHEGQVNQYSSLYVIDL